MVANLAEMPLKPKDCLLIVGLPLSEKDFATSLTTANGYAHSYLTSLPQDADIAEKAKANADAWRKAQKFIAPCKESLQRITELGGHVMIAPTVDELAAAATKFILISIFTHSVWQTIKPSDLKDPDGLIEALLFGDELASETYREWQDRALVTLPADFAGSTFDFHFRELASACQFSHNWWNERAGKRNLIDPRSLDSRVAHHLCRPELDRQFSKHILCDNGIEIGGRMCGIAELFGGLSKGNHQFIFDLRMCNSAMTFNSVKALFPDSLVAVNQWQTMPNYGLRRYAAILRHLKDNSSSYISACEHIQQAAINGKFRR